MGLAGWTRLSGPLPTPTRRRRDVPIRRRRDVQRLVTPRRPSGGYAGPLSQSLRNPYGPVKHETRAETAVITVISNSTVINN